MSQVQFRVEAPGLLVVDYAAPEDLEPQRQSALVQALREAGARGRAGVVFVVGAGVRSVHLDVPTFWLGVTGDRSISLAAMAVVTKSMAVRIAARGFAAANVVRRLPIAVEAFPALPEALSWVKGRLG